jgi:hypothetical protein
MKTVKVKLDGDLHDAQVFIDDIRLNFHNGKAEMDRPAGEHALTWFVRATPGTAYTVEITAPDESKFKHEGTVGSIGKDAGVQWFEVGD